MLLLEGRWNLETYNVEEVSKIQCDNGVELSKIQYDNGVEL